MYAVALTGTCISTELAGPQQKSVTLVAVVMLITDQALILAMATVPPTATHVLRWRHQNRRRPHIVDRLWCQMDRTRLQVQRLVAWLQHQHGLGAANA